jgi:hypothetical protein
MQPSLRLHQTAKPVAIKLAPFDTTHTRQIKEIQLTTPDPG